MRNISVIVFVVGHSRAFFKECEHGEEQGTSHLCWLRFVNSLFTKNLVRCVYFCSRHRYRLLLTLFSHSIWPAVFVVGFLGRLNLYMDVTKSMWERESNENARLNKKKLSTQQTWAIAAKIKCKYDINRTTNLNLFNTLKLNRHPKCAERKKETQTHTQMNKRKIKKGVPKFFYTLTIQMIYY